MEIPFKDDRFQKLQEPHIVMKSSKLAEVFIENNLNKDILCDKPFQSYNILNGVAGYNLELKNEFFEFVTELNAMCREWRNEEHRIPNQFIVNRTNVFDDTIIEKKTNTIVHKIEEVFGKNKIIVKRANLSRGREISIIENSEDRYRTIYNIIGYYRNMFLGYFDEHAIEGIIQNFESIDPVEYKHQFPKFYDSYKSHFEKSYKNIVTNENLFEASMSFEMNQYMSKILSEVRQRQIFVVQEYLKFELEVRYVVQLHNDSWRIAYGKQKRKVTGDGKMTVYDLYRTAESSEEKYAILKKMFPTLDISKKKLRGIFVNKLKRVISKKNEVYFDSVTANISRGAWSFELNSVFQKNIDRVVSAFFHDAGKLYGTKISYLAFDIGIVDRSVFEDKNANFEDLMKNAVYIECQGGAGVEAYIKKFTPEYAEKVRNYMNCTINLLHYNQLQ